MLRAGPLSDDSVIRLVNRRFIPFAFDLSNFGFLGDDAALKFVTAARKEYGNGMVNTPELLIMTPTGKVVGKVSNYGSTEQVLAALRGALEGAPEFAKPSADEAKLTGIDRAELHLDLLDLDGARAALESETSMRAHYLRGHIARRRGDWKAMERHFAHVEGDEYRDHLAMERAYELWHKSDYKALQATTAKVRASSARYTEARYYRGLALFHQKKIDAARTLWRETIASRAQDRWIYRADWALCASKQRQGRGSVMMTSDRKSESALGRIGYMGRRNPDLYR